MTRLFVCAGEASGDRLAAELVAELRARRPGIEVRGLCGPLMREKGIGVVARAEDVTAIGPVEVVRALPRIRRVVDDVLADIDRFRPDVVVTVDAPTLMLRLARRIRARGHRVVHWVSPQVWAWRPGRIPRIASSVDALLCLFPMESALYAGTGVRTVYTGHPVVERVRRLSIPRSPEPTIGLAPGSRSSEIRLLWPVFAKVAERIRAREPRARFVVPVAPTVDRGRLAGVDAELVDDMATCGSRCDVVLVASGTATLELCVLGTPMVVAYQVHPVAYATVRPLVRGVRHLGLPNVLAGRTIAPEHIQHLDPDAIASDVLRLLGPDGARQRRALLEVARTLGTGGAAARAADEVERWLSTP